MKCAILYATHERNVAAQCDGLYQQVYVSGHGYIFVRAELFEGELIEALDHVKCREGENFLNSTPLDTGTARPKLKVVA